MKDRLNLLVMGGDRRYAEMIGQLASRGIQIYAAGFDQLSFSHSNIRNENPDQVKMGEIDAILLPLGGTDVNGGIEAAYSDKPLNLTSGMLKQTPGHCTVFTGISNEYLDSAASEAGRKLVCLMDRDDVAILNAIPTAEAVLKIAIEETDRTIHGSKVMVLGFGRTGFTLARLFSAVGARVSVAARKDADLARAIEMGLEPLHFNNLTDHIGKIDICINTVPRLILDAAVLSKMNPSALVIDIASKPGGTDFTFAQEKGIKAVHALGLPGKTAPKTAGEIIGDVLYKLLVQQ